MDAERLYLDHAAATPMHPEARTLMGDLLGRAFANPSSAHAEGRYWKDVLEDARSRVAGAFGCRPREIVFTGSGTEAAQIAVHGLAAGGTRTARVSAIEHPAVLDAARNLEKQGQLTLTEVRPDKTGVVDPEALATDAPTPSFVALMLANHEMGAVQPVRALADLLAPEGVPLLCDASLAPGRLPCGRDDLGAQVVAFSGAKFGGAPGAGILYVRRGTQLAPPMGGGLQEERLRPGTENVAAWAATALAFERALSEQETRSARYGMLIETFMGAVGADVEWRPVGHAANCVPGVLTIEIPGVEGEAAMINMDLEGIAVATGSTCALGSADPSPGLLAMGFTRARASSTIRISVGEGVQANSMQRAASTLRGVVMRLRKLGRA